MKKHICKFLLGVIIVAQILFTAYAFKNWKIGFHSDEVWSYGFANSYYHPFLCLEDGAELLSFQDDQVTNWEQWFPGDEMWKYITVQEGERFAYGSVYYNNIYDMHPPLYYMLLHTVCSLFPESFSPWYGEVLNFLFLAITQIFLFLTVKKISDNEGAALVICLLYGGSRGALLTFTFIRQYSMLLALCMIFVYLSACFYDEIIKKRAIDRKSLVAACVTAGLAFWTHYYGILFVGAFTAAFCFYLLLRKKVKAMFAYGCGMSLALGAALVTYPAAIGHFLSDWKDEVTSYSPPVQFRYLLNELARYDYGFRINYFPTAFWDIALPLLLAGIVAVAALLHPFRDEAWYGKLMKWLKNTGRSFVGWIKGANYIPVFACAACLTIFGVVAKGVDVLVMAAYIFRYISLTVPFMTMALALLVWIVLGKILKTKKMQIVVFAGIVCGVLMRVNMTVGYPYAYPQAGLKTDITQETAGKSVLVMERLTDPFVTDITWFSQYLYRADEVCFTSQMTFEDYMGTEKFDGSRVDYLIVDTDVFRLSEEEKQMLEARDGIKFMAGDEDEQAVACTEAIKRCMDNRPYEIVMVKQGQKATYWILKFA